MFKLKWPQHPSPRWFSAGQTEHVGRVLDDGTVDAEGNKLYLLDGTLPSAGTEVMVTTECMYLVAEPTAEFHALQAREESERKAQQEAWQAQREREYRERQIRYQQGAEEENGKLHIPVRWTSGLKTVLSGLSQNSAGTGDNARSVIHILLLESLSDGRFHRSANTFLCTSAGGTNGKAWTERLHNHSVGVNGPYVSKVTCKQCLKLAQRWSDAPTGVPPEVVQG